MTGFDATEGLTPFRDERGQGYGAILFDGTRARQADPDWFSPSHWGEKARPVGSGGRGGAWFIDMPVGAVVLRQYLRGGWMAAFSRDGHLWRGSGRVRSFAEFRLLRELVRRGLPVPRPIAAQYVRDGFRYRAAILLERIEGARSLAERAATAGHDAPWEETGRLIARFHRVGLDHADLNASNLLFDSRGNGWVIDLDRSRLRIPATGWREANLSRLRRSLMKLRGSRSEADVDADFARLRGAYANTWNRGY
ncbi:3-deoxy-D-manno-octulosonic acid kinase [Luteimonas sp. SX5]|uniref:3-deoxy-D-manno-octulosonic acid kinase n=1 Tax=Luteimonas galliterrae TaxID=2940486 RepID=A0ABT0MIB9_9GAMM|nr:3-deoxy-D-manno-octulosonic acid kinase [Luteimonas galliterrae]MCL1634045.1 3-deoxy-D-manno-octulosonic acid kinase [Luteimonas galliterrae]